MPIKQTKPKICKNIEIHSLNIFNPRTGENKRTCWFQVIITSQLFWIWLEISYIDSKYFFLHQRNLYASFETVKSSEIQLGTHSTAVSHAHRVYGKFGIKSKFVKRKKTIQKFESMFHCKNTFIRIRYFWFGWLGSRHVNHCQLFNAKSSLYIYIKYI